MKAINAMFDCHPTLRESSFEYPLKEIKNI